MRLLLPLCCAIICLLSQSALRGQEAQRGVEIQPAVYDTLQRRNLAGVLFSRNLNTFDWSGRLLMDTSFSGNTIALIEQFTSNIIQVTPTSLSPKSKLISDQQNISVLLGRPLDEQIATRVRWVSFNYSDNKQVGLSNASINSVLGGVEYSPNALLSVSPMAGYRWDRQADIADRGLSLELSAKTRAADVEGYRITGNAQYHKDQLDPRTLESHFVHAGVQKYFAGLSRDSLEVGFSRNRREFYALADSTIESRVEDVFSFSNLLDYEISTGVLASAFIGVSSLGLDKSLRAQVVTTPGSFQFNTRIDESHLDTYLQASYRTDDRLTAAYIRLSHSERDEVHAAEATPGGPTGFFFDQTNKQEHEKDNLTRRTSLDGALSLPVSVSDRVSLSGAVSILRYDTPSEDNHEDRDEQLIAASLSTWHRLSRYLDMTVSLDGTISHLVYLLSDRSGNNNYNRVLRLAPRAVYRPTRALCTVNAFEVLANYTVYDFDAQQAQVRSFTYRQFGWMDSSAVELTDRIGVDLFVYLKLYERGQLTWSDFAERRESSSVDKTYAAQVRFSPEPSAMFAIGVRYFSQTRYAYTGPVKELDSFLSSVGPTCAVMWRMGPHSQLSFRGWYEQRKQPDGTQRSLPSMALSILVNL